MQTRRTVKYFTINRTKPQSKTKAQQKSSIMARKKDERATARHKEKKSSGNVDSDSKSLSEQLSKIGLKVRDVIGDGNCLFRALADQLDGDDRAHGRHRQDVVRYIKDHRSDFEPFIEDDVPFDKHVTNLSEDGTYAGNDAIVAFAKLHNLTVIIHQLGSPAWEVHGKAHDSSSSSGGSGVLQLHILYHSHQHYSSVRRIGDDSESPANVRIMSATRRLPASSPVVEDLGRHKTSGKNISAQFAKAPTKDDPTLSDRRRCLEADEFNAAEFVANMLASTKCQNEDFVADLYNDARYYDYDFDSLCDQELAALMYESLTSSPSISSSQSDGDRDTLPTTSVGLVESTTMAAAASGAKPKARQQTSGEKRQRKLEKKARAAMRHKQDAVGSKVALSSDDDDLSPYVLAQGIQVLQI